MGNFGDGQGGGRRPDKRRDGRGYGRSRLVRLRLRPVGLGRRGAVVGVLGHVAFVDDPAEMLVIHPAEAAVGPLDAPGVHQPEGLFGVIVSDHDHGVPADGRSDRVPDLAGGLFDEGGVHVGPDKHRVAGVEVRLDLLDVLDVHLAPEIDLEAGRFGQHFGTGLGGEIVGFIGHIGP